MAQNSTPSPSRARLARGPSGLARDVLSTEYGLNREIRADHRRAAEPGLLADIWQLLRRAANQALRAVGLGRGEEDASPGSEPEPEPAHQGRDQEQNPVQERGRAQVPPGEGVQQAWAPVPEHQAAFMSEKTRSLHERMARLEQALDGLPPARRADVEDAILKELRGPGNRKLMEALIAAPDSMPVLARSFNNATVRESTRMAPPGSGDVRPPEQRRPNAGVRREVTAEEALNAAQDSIMAADAAQFAAVRSQWERPARPRGSEAPRSFQDPSDSTLPDPDSLGLLEKQRLRDRESPTPEMREVEHHDGGAFLPRPTEELRSVAAQLNPHSTADFADLPNWPLEQASAPVSPLLDHIGLAVVNDPALAHGAPPDPGTTGGPSTSRPVSPVRQNGNSNGNGQLRIRRG